MQRLTLLIPALLGSLVLGCVDLTPMWEKNLDGGVAPGTGGKVAPGMGGTLPASGGIVTSGGIIAAGGALSDTGVSVFPATGGALAGDGGLGTGDTPGFDASLETGVADGKPATDAAPTGGADALGGAIATGGAPRTGGVVSTGGSSPDSGLPETAIDSANDLPVDPVPDAFPDTSLDTPLDHMPDDTAVSSGPLIHYRFESATGDLVEDDSGKQHSGTLVGPYSFVPGRVGNALMLTAPVGVDGGVPASYVSLPANVLSTVNDLTIATWINLNANVDWTRVFDFGASQTVYMFLTTSAAQTHRIRFAISTSGFTAEQQLEGPALSTGTWVHLAVVLDASGGKLFVNGAQAAANANLTLRTAALGDMINNWIGRSQFTTGGYNDPYYDGLIDDFRIYDRALGLTEITALAGL